MFMRHFYVPVSCTTTVSEVLLILSMLRESESCSHNKIDDSVFTQMSITKCNHSNTLYVSIFYCTLSMTVGKSDKKTYYEQEYYANRSVFAVNSSFLTAYALDLSTLLDLGDWGQAKQKMSSPIEGTKLSCIDKALRITANKNSLSNALRKN